MYTTYPYCLLLSNQATTCKLKKKTISKCVKCKIEKKKKLVKCLEYRVPELSGLVNGLEGVVYYFVIHF